VTQYLLFDAAGLDLAAPSDSIKTVHEELSVQSVSGTKEWFLGLAVAQGNLLPVTDIGAFAGRRSSNGITLELAPSVAIAGLQINNVCGFADDDFKTVTLTNIERQVIDDGNLTFTERAIVKGDRAFRLLDITSLVQTSEFLDIAGAADGPY